MNKHMQKVKDAQKEMELRRVKMALSEVEMENARKAYVAARDAFHKAQEELFVACVEGK